MAERYLEVEVWREQFSILHLCVDDEDPRFKKALKDIGLLGAVRPFLSTAAEELTREDDWEADTELREVYAHGVKEVSPKEAHAYGVFVVEPQKPEPDPNQCVMELG